MSSPCASVFRMLDMVLVLLRFIEFTHDRKPESAHSFVLTKNDEKRSKIKTQSKRNTLKFFTMSATLKSSEQRNSIGIQVITVSDHETHDYSSDDLTVDDNKVTRHQRGNGDHKNRGIRENPEDDKERQRSRREKRRAKAKRCLQNMGEGLRTQLRYMPFSMVHPTYYSNEQERRNR